MQNKNEPQTVTIRQADGDTRKIVVPRSARDVEAQPDVPAWVLALFAFAPTNGGTVVRWSPHTRDFLRHLSEEYGEPAFRQQLISLLIDMEDGFVPSNPVGLICHRLRAAGTTRTLQI